jgi:flagellar hook-length control protein FliK
MSASPLPSLPITPPPQQQQTSAPRSNNPQHSGTSFNSHLQSAQHQSSSDPTQNGDATQNGNNKQGAAAQAGNPSNNTATPGKADASKTDDAADSSNIGIDITGGIAALAGTVLGLIDHATSDTHGDATPATHAAPAKPATPSGDKQLGAVQPDALAATMMPTPLPIATTAVSATTDSGAQAANGVGAALSQKISAFASANADDASISNTSNVSATADGGASTPTAGDNVQTFAAGLAAINHASIPATTTTATDNGSQVSPDLSALSSLTAAASAIPASATSGATHNLAMNQAVGSQGFAKELGQQITWLSGQEVKQAQIRLNPQDLGPLDVKISVEHGRVDVSFMTQHPATTVAVQQGLDQLNQMLGGQGLSLGHTTVGQHAQQQFAGQQGQQAQTFGHAGDDATDTPIASVARAAVGLVDAFA